MAAAIQNKPEEGGGGGGGKKNKKKKKREKKKNVDSEVQNVGRKEDNNHSRTKNSGKSNAAITCCAADHEGQRASRRATNASRNWGIHKTQALRLVGPERKIKLWSAVFTNPPTLVCHNEYQGSRADLLGN